MVSPIVLTWLIVCDGPLTHAPCVFETLRSGDRAGLSTEIMLVTVTILERRLIALSSVRIKFSAGSYLLKGYGYITGNFICVCGIIHVDLVDHSVIIGEP